MGLGSRRLSIIDIAGGRQPLANEDGTIWAVCNGEIYNFQELRRRLEDRGHRFTTHADTEVIVHLYEEQQEACVAAFEGMFAIAIWDARRQRLILARDRFGKKPLFYAEGHGGLTFASELHALLLDPTIPRELDPHALEYYLTYRSIPAPRSIFRAVRKLPPAHVLVAEPSGTRLHRYWSLRYLPKLAISEPEAAERLLVLLTEAVKKRLISEVPLGAFLSGGVDSSAVVALMAQLSGAPVKTFSVGFEEASFNELPHARRVAQRFGCEHHEFVVRPWAVDVLPTLIHHFGEPFADSSAVPTFYLCKLSRQYVTVAMNGDGGDEAFAGYQRHLAHRFAESWQRAPASLRRPLRWMSRAVLPTRVDPKALVSRFHRFLEASELSRIDRYRQWVGVFSGDLLTQVCLLKADADEADQEVLGPLFEEARGLDAVDAALAVDTAFYLPTDLLVKMDIMSMAHSLETRSPFLDHHLVEFTARLPTPLKLRGWTSKYLLKRILRGVIPAENLHREKAGFSVPIAAWFRGELREFMADHLLASHAARGGLLRQPAMTMIVTEHLRGRTNYGQHLWTLLVLELWYRTYVERTVPEAVHA